MGGAWVPVLKTTCKVCEDTRTRRPPCTAPGRSTAPRLNHCNFCWERYCTRLASNDSPDALMRYADLLLGPGGRRRSLALKADRLM